jgi:hypothetical protein
MVEKHKTIRKPRCRWEMDNIKMDLNQKQSKYQQKYIVNL